MRRSSRIAGVRGGAARVHVVQVEETGPDEPARSFHVWFLVHWVPERTLVVGIGAIFQKNWCGLDRDVHGFQCVSNSYVLWVVYPGASFSTPIRSLRPPNGGGILAIFGHVFRAHPVGHHVGRGVFLFSIVQRGPRGGMVVPWVVRGDLVVELRHRAVPVLHGVVDVGQKNLVGRGPKHVGAVHASPVYESRQQQQGRDGEGPGSGRWWDKRQPNDGQPDVRQRGGHGNERQEEGEFFLQTGAFEL